MAKANPIARVSSRESVSTKGRTKPTRMMTPTHSSLARVLNSASSWA